MLDVVVDQCPMQTTITAQSSRSPVRTTYKYTTKSLSCRWSRRSAPVTQYNSAIFVQTHQKSRPNSFHRSFKGIDPLVRCLHVWKRSWYQLFTIWAEVERLNMSNFDMCSEEKQVGAADKSTKWPSILYRMIWVSLLVMELCILRCMRYRQIRHGGHVGLKE